MRVDINKIGENCYLPLTLKNRYEGVKSYYVFVEMRFKGDSLTIESLPIKNKSQSDMEI